MGDLTVAAIVFLVVVWALVLGTAGITLLRLTKNEKNKKK